MCLADDGEEPSDLYNLRPEEILIRWMNYHLARAGVPTIDDLEEDITEPDVLIKVMN